MVVVYKVDRLTRSLADFAKMVEAFDAHGVSFVSVTQQFNTTTSMGRLTLNVLLSFAQFEREVTGERIRDKIAASKRKGMWMGGLVPLGYDVRDRHLVVNETEAATVREIFRCYLELGSVRLLKAELDRRGVPVEGQSREQRDAVGRPIVLTAAPCTPCSAIRFISVRFATRASAIRASTKRSSSGTIWEQVQTILSAHRCAGTERTIKVRAKPARRQVVRRTAASG